MYKLAIAALIAAALASGLGFYTWNGSHNDGVTFRTFVVKREAIVRKIRATGTLEPEKLVDVGAQISGRIVSLGEDLDDCSKTVDFGSRVQQGTLLARVDDTQLSARVFSAEANLQRSRNEFVHASIKLELAQQTWERKQRLQDVDPAVLIQQTEMEFKLAAAASKISKSAVAQAEATLREAEVALADATISSPVQGVVIDRRAQVGQTVGTTGNSLFLIAKDLRQLEIWASVNEADVGIVERGQRVTFNVAAYPEQEFQGAVKNIRLNARVTGNIVTYTVVVAFDNHAGQLLPYMTADMVFEVERRNEVLQVPNSAFRWRPERHEVAIDVDPSLYTLASADSSSAESKDSTEPAVVRKVVWALDPEGRVRPISVQTGITDGFKTEITDDQLEEGTSIVIGRIQKVKEYNNILVAQIKRGKDK